MSKKLKEAQIELPMEMPSYIKDEGRGQENVGVEDIAIPRIVMLQDLSPQVKKNKPEYVEGAEPGKFLNTVTNEVYDDLTICPVYFRKEYILWKDRESGGGFYGSFPTKGSAEKAQVEEGLEMDGEVVDTAQQFVLIVKEDGIEEAVMSFSKGLMGASRQLNSLVKMSGGDRFARLYKALPKEVQGQKGDYWSVQFQPLGWAPEEVYLKAEKVYEAIAAGQRQVDYGDE